MKNKSAFSGITKQQNEKMKTLCTLDCSDINVFQKANKNMNKSPQNRNGSIDRRKSSLAQYLKTRKRKYSKSKQYKDQLIAKAYSTMTPKSASKKIKLKIESCDVRLKTEHFHSSEHQQGYFDTIQSFSNKKSAWKTKSLNKIRNLSEFKGKVKADKYQKVKSIEFKIDDKYNVDPFYILRTVSKSKAETVLEVQFLNSHNKYKNYLMKSSEDPRRQEIYRKQILIKQNFTDRLQVSDHKLFSSIFKHYSERRTENLPKKSHVVVYYKQGERLSWHKNIHKKLLQNIQLNDFQILKHIVKEVSKCIKLLSEHCLCHPEIRLQNLLLNIQQNEVDVKVNKHIKLGSIWKCFPFHEDKRNLLDMQACIYTPPEILNYMIFEKSSHGVKKHSSSQQEGRNEQTLMQKHFDRKTLDFMYCYDQSWRVQIWSLGVLILDILNKNPYFSVDPSLNHIELMTELLKEQKNITIRYQKLLYRLQDSTFKNLVARMLSWNPYHRPSPTEIISFLS